MFRLLGPYRNILIGLTILAVLSNALTLASLIPRAQLHVYPHCGHWTQIEWASSFNDMVGRFLAND